MKSFRIMMSLFLLSFSTAAFAQSDPHKSVDKAPESDAQKSFTQLRPWPVPGKAL